MELFSRLWRTPFYLPWKSASNHDLTQSRSVSRSWTTTAEEAIARGRELVVDASLSPGDCSKAVWCPFTASDNNRSAGWLTMAIGLPSDRHRKILSSATLVICNLWTLCVRSRKKNPLKTFSNKTKDLYKVIIIVPKKREEWEVNDQVRFYGVSLSSLPVKYFVFCWIIYICNNILY